jgi:hypothetical protein
MNRRARIYILLVSLVGAGLAALSFGRFVGRIMEVGLQNDAFELVCLIFLCTISGALPIYMRSNQALMSPFIRGPCRVPYAGDGFRHLYPADQQHPLYLYDIVTKPKSAATPSGW